MPVHVIEALPSVSIIPQAEQEQRKKNVIGYARVSTTEQESSYESQLAYFEDLIRRNPDWNFCGMYSDESSGTTTKKRDGFNRMIRACEEGGVDIIVCKSLSRFSRNVVDAISQIRRLRELGVNLWLQKENVWTMEESGELLLVVLSSLAQAESQSISVNVSLGIRYKMQRGIPMINCSRFLGYDKDPISKKLVINPFEARIVRFIYRAFLEGFSIPEIAKKLREADVPTITGKAAWATDTVKYILQNEKYVGDLLMQKTYCQSFLTHKTVKNKGKLPQYYVADNHDPIVPREVFNLTQSLLTQRGHCDGHPGQRKYNLSGRVICGCCGSEYKRFAGGRRPAATTPTTPVTPAEAITSTTPAEAAAGTEATAGRVCAESGAVWKCKARACAKDATKARARLGSPLPSMGDGCDRGSVWRCQSPIIPEEKLTAAVGRALALLPREAENIRAIQESCRAALSMAASTQDGAGEESEQSATQLLLLHTDTALRYLEGEQSGTAGRQDAACKTLDSFIARTPMTPLTSMAPLTPMEGLGDPVELLIDRVVIDGDKIKVRFKAGVEI